MTNKMDVKGRVEYVVNLNAALLERSGYSQEAYCRVVLNAMVQTPQLGECDEASLQQALLASMNAGLVPDGKEGGHRAVQDTRDADRHDRGPAEVGATGD